jgi:hypothetical protein
MAAMAMAVIRNGNQPAWRKWRIECGVAAWLSQRRHHGGGNGEKYRIGNNQWRINNGVINGENEKSA